MVGSYALGIDQIAIDAAPFPHSWWSLNPDLAVVIRVCVRTVRCANGG